jgi:ERF superfamily
MIMNVYQKLNEARDKFHQSELKKSGHNKFAGYSYFELGDFVVPALRIFKEVGLTSIITFGKEEAQMLIVNTDKPDEVITITTPMSEASLKGCHPVQNLGAVETYLRRYLWVAAMEIVEHDPLDATTGNKTMQEEAPPKKVIANRYEEQDPKNELFVESMINWGNSCTSLTELTDLWKTNQPQIDELKKNSKELFKRVQEHFAQLKANFKEE